MPGEHQVPGYPVAETRSFAGPLLRYASGCGDPLSSTWKGSVLCLSREAVPVVGAAGAPTSAASAAAAAAVANGAPAAGSSPAAAGVAGAEGAQEAPEPALLLDAGLGGPQRPSAHLLDSCLGWAAWRFDLELPILEYQRPVRYSVSAGGTSTPVYTFWLPALGQPMHWGYYSCNGMSADVPPSAPERQDVTYLWRDLLQLHSAFPLHCLVGGGDQCYNDGVWKCPSLHKWGGWTDQ